MGFNDFLAEPVNLPFPVSSNSAPNNALVAGGYFNAKRIKAVLSFSCKCLNNA